MPASFATPKPFTAVLEFWFDPVNRPHWFSKSATFDEQIRLQFLATWHAAANCQCAPWRAGMDGRLAEIIVLDQFSRNLFRHSAAAYTQDALALRLAEEAVVQPEFDAMPQGARHFMLMPFMHSEDLAVQQRALVLFAALGDSRTFEIAQRHKYIIERFGRYPHRNVVLGRTSTAEEEAFLQEPDSSF